MNIKQEQNNEVLELKTQRLEQVGNVLYIKSGWNIYSPMDNFVFAFYKTVC